MNTEIVNLGMVIFNEITPITYQKEHIPVYEDFLIINEGKAKLYRVINF